MPKVSIDKIVIGRVLHEDAEMMTIEVYKNEDRVLDIQDGDRYNTLLFTKHLGNGKWKSWKPWEK